MGKGKMSFRDLVPYQIVVTVPAEETRAFPKRIKAGKRYFKITHEGMATSNFRCATYTRMAE